MGIKELKTRERLSSYVDKSIAYDIKKYSKETGIPISKILDKSISMYLKTIGKATR